MCTPILPIIWNSVPARGLPGVLQTVLYVACFESLVHIITDPIGALFTVDVCTFQFCHQFHGPTKFKLCEGHAQNYIHSSVPSATGMHCVMADRSLQSPVHWHRDQHYANETPQKCKNILTIGAIYVNHHH